MTVSAHGYTQRDLHPEPPGLGGVPAAPRGGSHLAGGEEAFSEISPSGSC